MQSFSEIKKIASKGNVIPLFTRIPADLDTPVSAFIKLAKNRSNSFLLESIEGGEKLARYSFVGFDPFIIVEGQADKVIVHRGRKSQTIKTEPIEFLRELFSIYRPIRIEGLPRFTGGAVGYFSYDSIRWIEDIPDENTEQMSLPEFRFGLYRHIIAFDHLKQEIVIIANILHDQKTDGLKRKYTEASKWIKRSVDKLSRTCRVTVEKNPDRVVSKAQYGQKEFEQMVRKAKKYIKEGDIFQVVLSQRWNIKTKVSPLTVYRRLRRLNPSPYMFLLNFGKDSIVGSSPEMLVRIEDKTIETRPIAGTRPRGKNEAEDEKQIADLMSDEKELAEHTMLLDLGRNDVGRVATPGSVVVRDNMIIEKYSHVIHIVSSVVGKLKTKTSALDGHFACFPAGTVSGAPKIRAMEIIDELEKIKRGVYAGSIAYIDFWGSLDSCIAIRTVVRSQDTYYVQAGAGIVADSKPAAEFHETRAKAKVLIEAVTGRKS